MSPRSSQAPEPDSAGLIARAWFRGARLCGARLCGAWFRGARFRGARLCGRA
ncbi:MAG: pentapeptide repeat-containing protein [Rhodobacteraceae bacterium]|nr:pentapeptide repeat-containing protein [Paracoccaceae bacterium]